MSDKITTLQLDLFLFGDCFDLGFTLKEPGCRDLLLVSNQKYHQEDVGSISFEHKQSTTVGAAGWKVVVDVR